MRSTAQFLNAISHKNLSDSDHHHHQVSFTRRETQQLASKCNILFSFLKSVRFFGGFSKAGREQLFLVRHLCASWSVEASCNYKQVQLLISLHILKWQLSLAPASSPKIYLEPFFSSSSFFNQKRTGSSGLSLLGTPSSISCFSLYLLGQFGKRNYVSGLVLLCGRRDSPPPPPPFPQRTTRASDEGRADLARLDLIDHCCIISNNANDAHTHTLPHSPGVGSGQTQLLATSIARAEQQEEKK